MALRGSSLSAVMRLLAPLATLLLLATAAPPAVEATQVTSFTPQGTVKRVRQASARFSEPMVPLGDPRAADPFDVTCPEAGAGRWADSRDWVYDFARDLPAGVRCTFRLRAGLTTLRGAALTGRGEFAFSTGGPAVLSSTPREGDRGIDEEQAFLLVLDAEPTADSLLGRRAGRRSAGAWTARTSGRPGARCCGRRSPGVTPSRSSTATVGSWTRRRSKSGGRPRRSPTEALASTAGAPAQARPRMAVPFDAWRKRRRSGRIVARGTSLGEGVEREWQPRDGSSSSSRTSPTSTRRSSRASRKTARSW